MFVLSRFRIGKAEYYGIEEPLHDFSIIQLFNLVNLANKTGLLTVENNSTSAKVFFKREAYSGPDEQRAGYYSDVVTAQGRQDYFGPSGVILRARSQTDKELGCCSSFRLL